MPSCLYAHLLRRSPAARLYPQVEQVAGCAGVLLGAALAGRVHGGHHGLGAHARAPGAGEQPGRCGVGHLGARLHEELLGGGGHPGAPGKVELVGQRDAGAAVPCAQPPPAERDVAHDGGQRALPHVVDAQAGGKLGAQRRVQALQRPAHGPGHDGVALGQGAALERGERQAAGHEHAGEDVGHGGLRGRGCCRIAHRGFLSFSILGR